MAIGISGVMDHVSGPNLHIGLVMRLLLELMLFHKRVRSSLELLWIYMADEMEADPYESE